MTRKNHPPILVLAGLGLGLLLAIAGGPVLLGVLLLAGPPLLLVIFSVRAVLGFGSAPRADHSQRDARR